MRKHLIDLRADLPNARGAGYDQRTGEVVLLVTRADAERFGADAIRTRAEQVSGVPVRVVINELNDQNMGVDGGGRVEGVNSVTGRRNVCTSGFRRHQRNASKHTTAAHCPDELTYSIRTAPDDTLPMIGSVRRGLSGRADQHRPEAPEPLFYANRGADSLRAVTTWRNRGSTRAGDFVCHYRRKLRLQLRRWSS